MLIALQGAVSQGVLWGIMVLGVFITFRLLDIPDMTCDGSFALGGCVCAVLIVNNNVDPLLAVLAGMCAGAIAGAVTGILTTVFEIPAILAGILTQISLWSINLRIMGKSNTPILAKGTVFSAVSNMTGLPQSTVAIILGILLAVAIVAILYWFFGTEIGSALRATGNNEYMIRALGVNTNSTKMIALVLSNALIGLSGALICQSQKYADIGMGTGASLSVLPPLLSVRCSAVCCPAASRSLASVLPPPSLAPWSTSLSAPSCCKWAWTPTT